MTTFKMTKLIPIGIAIALSTPASAIAIPHRGAKGIPEALKECTEGWRLSEFDANGQLIQSQCVVNPQCPGGTKVGDFNIGERGYWLTCIPCGQEAGQCIRDLPL